jgi:translin
VSKLTNNLESVADWIRQVFSAKDAAREKALPLCREVIRHCSQAIRAAHRQEFEHAGGELELARRTLGEAKQAVIAYEELSSASFIKDSQKEYAEGCITLALVTGKQLPSPNELGVDAAAYLNGMGEAVGELRRYLLDSIRRGDLSRGEELLSAMDDIYTVLITMDFPDAITSGLRRTTDMVRGILERTRSDLTLVISQNELKSKLEKLEHGID